MNKNIPTLGDGQGGQQANGPLTFEEAVAQSPAYKMISFLDPGQPGKPIVIQNRARNATTTRLEDLPLDNSENATKLHAWVDMVDNWSETPDLKACEILYLANDYKNLPGMLKVNGDIALPYTMQAFVVPKSDGTKVLLKHIILDKDFKMKVDDIQQTCHGELKLLNYGRHNRNGSKSLQMMLERLPGFQVLYFKLASVAGPKKATDKASQDIGFAYIRDHGPKSNIDNKATEFAEIHTKDPDSPIFGWAPSLVERSCLNYGKGLVAARKQSFYHLTLKDVKGWFLDLVLAKILGSFMTTTFMFLGVSGIGKSPLGKILAMLISCFWIQRDAMEEIEPGFRLTNNFEHLRHEPGSKYVSEMFDDGDLQLQTAEKLKAFQDNTEEQSRTVEKYTTTTLINQSGRLTINNPINEDAEKDRELDHITKQITAKAWFNMARPSFAEKMNEQDFAAVLKRATVVLFTKKRVYYRNANQDLEKAVPFENYPEGEIDLLTDDCKDFHLI